MTLEAKSFSQAKDIFVAKGPNAAIEYLAGIDDEEFDDLYREILSLIRENGTAGVELMLMFVERELAEGREEIE